MSAVAGNANLYPPKSATENDTTFSGQFTLTTAGAVAASPLVDDPVITLTKSGTTGQYDLVFPAFPGAVQIEVTEIYSPLGTIGQWYTKARSSTAGTASIIFSNPAGTAAYGASGDIISVAVRGNSRGT